MIKASLLMFHVSKKLNIFSELDGDNKFSLNLLQQQTSIGAAGARTRDNCSITAGLDNDIDQGTDDIEQVFYKIYIYFFLFQTFLFLVMGTRN